MRYKTTRQYARGEEVLVAAFCDLEDLALFLDQKSATTKVDHQSLVFRVYEDMDLIHELNPDQLTTAHARYADGSAFLDIVSLPFKVLVKREPSSMHQALACFQDKDDATLFIASKCEDEQVGGSELFLLMKGPNLMETSNKAIHAHQKLSAEKPQKQESKFRIRPMQKGLKPQGSPGDFWIEEDEDEPS
jgi:hypothetical protein